MKSKRIGFVDDSIRDLANDMIQTTLDWDHDSEFGAALAAIQIGEPLKLTVVRNDFDDAKSKEFTTLVNPEIVKSSNENVSDVEGCLSVPGVYGRVSRPLKIKVKAQDINGDPIRLTLEGFPARLDLATHRLEVFLLVVLRLSEGVGHDLRGFDESILPVEQTARLLGRALAPTGLRLLEFRFHHFLELLRGAVGVALPKDGAVDADERRRREPRTRGRERLIRRRAQPRLVRGESLPHEAGDVRRIKALRFEQQRDESVLPVLLLHLDGVRHAPAEARPSMISPPVDEDRAALQLGHGLATVRVENL